MVWGESIEKLEWRISMYSDHEEDDRTRTLQQRICEVIELEQPVHAERILEAIQEDYKGDEYELDEIENALYEHEHDDESPVVRQDDGTYILVDTSAEEDDDN
jgi:hypothetical protein